MLNIRCVLRLKIKVIWSRIQLKISKFLLLFITKFDIICKKLLCISYKHFQLCKKNLSCFSLLCNYRCVRNVFIYTIIFTMLKKQQANIFLKRIHFKIHLNMSNHGKVIGICTIVTDFN